MTCSMEKSTANPAALPMRLKPLPVTSIIAFMRKRGNRGHRDGNCQQDARQAKHAGKADSFRTVDRDQQQPDQHRHLRVVGGEELAKKQQFRWHSTV